jgi:hypothetical protein
MTADDDRTNMTTRRETRYVPLVRPLLRIESMSEAPAEMATSATLLDISRGGAKLLLDANLAIGSALALHFDQPTLVAQGKVCWSRQSQAEGWWVACALEPPLTEEALSALLKQGCVERRRDERHQVRIPALARWPMGDPVAVNVCDYSGGGLCLSSPHGAQRGQRMLLHLGDTAAETSTMVEVQWSIQFVEEHLIGCSFLHRQGLDVVRRAAADLRCAVAGEPTSNPQGLRGPLAHLKAAWKTWTQRSE